jgi:hypothetical protein
MQNADILNFFLLVWYANPSGAKDRILLFDE